MPGHFNPSTTNIQTNSAYTVSRAVIPCHPSYNDLDSISL